MYSVYHSICIECMDRSIGNSKGNRIKIQLYTSYLLTIILSFSLFSIEYYSALLYIHIILRYNNRI